MTAPALLRGRAGESPAANCRIQSRLPCPYWEEIKPTTRGRQKSDPVLYHLRKNRRPTARPAIEKPRRPSVLAGSGTGAPAGPAKALPAIARKAAARTQIDNLVDFINPLSGCSTGVGLLLRQPFRVKPTGRLNDRCNPASTYLRKNRRPARRPATETLNRPTVLAGSGIG
jgi:hypothetical protein